MFYVSRPGHADKLTWSVANPVVASALAVLEARRTGYTYRVDHERYGCVAMISADMSEEQAELAVYRGYYDHSTRD